MKILVVEDSRANMQLLNSFIEGFGSTCIQAENGEQAITRFQSERPDLILLDVILPDTDGFAVARRIRALESDGGWTPIIFLSSLGNDEDIERGIEAGGDDYLHKPVSEIVLGAKVRAMERLVQMRARLLETTRKLDLANQELQRLSAMDGLTGIANRRFFDETMAREWRRAQRNHGHIAVMMCDVDHFKRYNDSLGHQAGDDCLRRIARLIAGGMARAADVAARYGGEEFVVILPETPLGGALFVAEKIRHALHEANLPHPDSPFGRITLSIGIAAAQPGQDDHAESLISAADRALYQAKHNGRDRVCREVMEPA